MAERNVPDSDEARRKYRGLAAVYDRRIRFMAPIRRRGIGRRCLQPGEHVLDMGCGTGASFAALREAVGPTGRVSGVHRLAFPVNVIVKSIARRYITTFEGFDAPWSHLAGFVPDLRVRRVLAGGGYVAVGHVGPRS